MKQHTSMCCC